MNFQITNSHSYLPQQFDDIPLANTIQIKEDFTALTSQRDDPSLENNAWGEIRTQAVEYNRSGKYAEAIKLCLKLLDNSLSTPEDTKFLTTVVFNLINQPRDCIKDLNFNEIQAIISSFKKANLHDKTDINNNNNLIQHLISKTDSLAKVIESHTQKLGLLLKSNTDKASCIATLPMDVIHMITFKYMDIIADIGQTPVDISRTEVFPVYIRTTYP